MLIGDSGYGTADLLGWLVEEKQITPHIPVFDNSEGKQELFGRSNFTWDPEQDHYLCPAGKSVGRNHRNFKNKRTGITKANTITYRASQSDCGPCPLKSQCSPTTPARKIQRSIHEAARDLARSLKHTDAYAQSRNAQKKVVMLFGHLKRIMRFDQLRLRGPNGANDEFLL